MIAASLLTRKVETASRPYLVSVPSTLKKWFLWSTYKIDVMITAFIEMLVTKITPYVHIHKKIIWVT